MSLPTRVVAKVAAINWPLWGLVVLLQLLWTFHWYTRGADSCAASQVAAVVASVQERLPVVQQAERGAAQMEQDLRTIKERLDEEVAKPSAVDCSVSDEQLQLYRAISERTR